MSPLNLITVKLIILLVLYICAQNHLLCVIFTILTYYNYKMYMFQH